MCYNSLNLNTLECVMKKKRILGLMLLAPLALLSACGGGSSLTYSANWNKITSDRTVEGTAETLEYDITFTLPTNVEDMFYYVMYEGGTYVTKLEGALFEFNDGTKEYVYHLTQEWNIRGHYVYENKPGETFTDTMTSEIWFHEVDAILRPIQSIKTVYSTSPVLSPSEEEICKVYNFRRTVSYDTMEAPKATLTKAFIKTDDLTTDEDNDNAPVEVKIKDKDRFLDNEQILFAFRGLDMDTAESFRTINPQNDKDVPAAILETPSATTVLLENFTINGKLQGKDENEDGDYAETIDAYRVRFGYKTNPSGLARTAYYAKKVSASDNTYRNALLRFEDPLTNNFGKLVYTLKSATFNEK